jgi:hypothetical protein
LIEYADAEIDSDESFKLGSFRLLEVSEEYLEIVSSLRVSFTTSMSLTLSVIC